MITVITKLSNGNEVIGDMQTVVEFFPDDTPIEKVYKTMRDRGNWDIVIPRIQPVTQDK